MSRKQRFRSGIGLITGAVVFFVLSIRIVEVSVDDMPNPTLQFSKPFLVLSVISALAGVVFFAWNFRVKT